MGVLQDFNQQHLYILKRYWLRELLNLHNWQRTFSYRHQRAERGWSIQDTWGGGEYVAKVLAGILEYLDRQQNPIDWDEYFTFNYDDNWGYKTLTEVADDLLLYVEWDILQFSEPYYTDIRREDVWAMDYQVYEQAKNAMHFVASNLGGLWW